MTVEQPADGRPTCSGCGELTMSVYYMCDQEVEDRFYCTLCFGKHPCGKGEHGEECPTLVHDDWTPRT